MNGGNPGAVRLVLVAALSCASLAWSLPPRPNSADDTFAVQRSALTARGYLVHSDGRVPVMIELFDPPAAVVWAQTLAAPVHALELGARAAAVAAARTQLARIEQAQQDVVQALADQVGAALLYRVQRVYNGVAVEVDAGQVEALRALPGVKDVHPLRPKRLANSTSVPFIGAPQVWDSTGLNVTGTGIRIGLIDSGIDYLHKDFGGSGVYPASATYTDPNWPKSAKVVGGTDLCGDAYDSDSSTASKRKPQPDPDPMDCMGHGTHVAGTVGGYGVTIDGNTYPGPYGPETPFSALAIGPGLAPGAQLYAVRVFGCSGSTGLVTKGLDWALDPNQDGNIADHLDVVNLSLGSDFGAADDPEAVAANNAALAGMSVVVAAGNGGDNYFIVGTPSTGDRVISVAAVGDPGAVTYTLRVTSPSDISGDYVAVPAAFGPVLPGQSLSGDLVYTVPADACAALSNGDEIKGKIAFTDRGTCNFTVKVKNAQDVGAAAVVVANNKDGDTLVTMSGSDPTITIPSGFISQKNGDTIRAELPSPGVAVVLLKLSLQDILASFSSRGPRLGDFALKPEISAPGLSIVSAAAGTGTGGAIGDGTSMATPHVTGVIALLKQLHPAWTVEQLKAVVMNTAARPLYLNANLTPPLVGPGRTGAGRVDAAAAAATPASAYAADGSGLVSLRFGVVEVPGAAARSALVKVSNDSDSAITYALGYESAVHVPGVSFAFPGGASVTVPELGSATFETQLVADAAPMKHTHDPGDAETSSGIARYLMSEEAGFVTLTPATGQALRVPLYAVPRPNSVMAAGGPGLEMTAAQGVVTLPLVGQGINTGSSYATDVVSLVSAFELQEDDEPKFSGSVAFVGVTSDYQAQVAKGKGIADTTIYFGIAVSSTWSSPKDQPLTVSIDTTGSGNYNFALTNSDPGGDTWVAKLCPTGSGSCHSLPLNGVAANVRDTVVFGTDVVVLPVSAAALGLGDGSSRFRYRVVSSVHSFDPAQPALWFGGEGYLGTAAEQPLFNDLPGQTIVVLYDRALYASDKALGVLLLHHHNAVGARVQVVALPKPHRVLRRS
jgi:subtilisin family serine protease